MTAPDGLLRDAGGARPTSDVDALIERLQGFNPPDRTIASQRDYSQAIHDAAAALVQLREENARLRAGEEKLRYLLIELVAQVRGECPSLLDEDSGGDARLSMVIDDAIIEGKK